MNKKLLIAALIGILCGLIFVLSAQEGSVVIKLVGSDKPAIAVPDFRGSGAAQALMGAFNETLFNNLQNSGLFKMVPKGMYPLQIPQRPEDFRQPARAGASAQGLWFTDWTSPPTSANFLATGYTAEQNGQIVLYGWLFDVAQPNLANAQILGKR